jgi:hypothetical protein
MGESPRVGFLTTRILRGFGQEILRDQAFFFVKLRQEIFE